jgi:hypothetical protein
MITGTHNGFKPIFIGIYMNRQCQRSVKIANFTGVLKRTAYKYIFTGYFLKTIAIKNNFQKLQIRLGNFFNLGRPPPVSHLPTPLKSVVVTFFWALCG